MAVLSLLLVSLASAIPTDVASVLAQLRSESTCSVVAGGKTVNLEGMKAKADYTGQDQEYKYVLNFCNTALEPACADKQGMMCQFRLSNNEFVATIIKSGSDTAEMLDDGGVKLTYRNGDQCFNAGTPVTRTAVLTINCKSSSSTTFVVTENPDTCVFSIVLASKAICGGGTGGGGGGGAIFLIIVLVVVVLYVVIGCIYYRKKKGTTGMKESCPHNEFWFAVPSLVKDGCSYTVMMIKTGCKGKGSYEEL